MDDNGNVCVCTTHDCACVNAIVLVCVRACVRACVCAMHTVHVRVHVHVCLCACVRVRVCSCVVPWLCALVRPL